jgi:hypothetical protein
MSPDSETTKFHPSLPKALTSSAVGTFAVLLLNLPPALNAQTSSQAAPPVIPEFSVGLDPSGLIATYQPSGETQTSGNPFFQNLGTNGRTCFTCHQPQTGWTVSAAAAQARFYSSAGMDPLFRPVDGATCPTADVSTLHAREQAYRLLTGKGLIRIAIPLPPNQFTNNLQFEVSKVEDPYNCTSLTSKTSGTLSMYRRPLPATNLGFLSTAAPTIMWDGREPSLAQQSIDATIGHAEANAAPSPDQQDQIVTFETGLFTAQIFDSQAGNLNAAGASGGPVALSFEIGNFFVGVNDPLGNNPKGTSFNPNIFNLYKSRIWSGLGDNGILQPAAVSDDSGILQRASIARGEVVFNTTPINITGVVGLNDVLGMKNIPGFCGTCHDTAH